MTGDSELSVQVAFDLRLLDAQGRTVWAQPNDSGRQVWDHPLFGKEQKDDGIVRLAHEGAWRLTQRAVVDLRDWAAGEPLKARELSRLLAVDDTGGCAKRRRGWSATRCEPSRVVSRSRIALMHWSSATGGLSTTWEWYAVDDRTTATPADPYSCRRRCRPQWSRSRCV